MNKNFTPKSRQDNLVVQELEGEVLIYDLQHTKAFCLNKTSALVWQSCDGSRTIAEIGDEVGKQLNSQINEDVVWLALDQLSKENLITNKGELTNKFAGVSRREVIRKIGLGTMIALPVITSLVAPMAVHALSTCPATPPAGCTGGTGRAPGCACSGNGNCASNTCIPATGGNIQCCA
jgi:hypothetical protein